MKRTPNWDNYIMRKYGQSVRTEIANSFGAFARALIILKRERTLDELLEKIPEDKCRAA